MEPVTPTTSAELNALHERYMFPCVGNYYEDPRPMAAGRGTRLVDVDGNEYLDFFGGILTISVGHCNETVNAAVREQSETLQHVSTLYPTEPLVRLAERLAGITPGDLQKCFFTCSGSEADETAVLLARLATGRDEVIALRYGYSGRTEVAMSLTGQGPWRRGGTAVGYVRHAHNAYCYRCAFGLEYPGCGLRCAYDVEELIRTTTSGEIAAFIAEPIQGVGGFVVPPKEYFEVVVDIIRRHGGLFICDEVQTGFGRTGDVWCGIEHWGVEPDIMTFAKGIANGFPLSATVAVPEVADCFGGLSISTFGGNPVSAAASLATMECIERDDLLIAARVQGDRLRAGLEALQEKYPIIGDVRGMGLMQALEIVDPYSSSGKEPDPETVKLLFEETRKRGVLVGKGGLYGNVIRVSPPLTVTATEIDDALAAVDEALGAHAGCT